MHTAARVKAWHEAAREVCGILFFSGTLNINLFAHAQDWMSGLLLTKGDSHGVLRHLRLTVCLAHTYLAQSQSQSTRYCRVSAPCRLGAMQAARQAFQQVARRSVQQVKGSRNMSSDASSEKAHLDEAMKEMSKWYVGS